MKTFLFDMDGVLLDSEIAALQDCADLICSYGHEATVEDLHFLIGPSSTEVAHLVLDRYELPLSVEGLSEIFREQGRRLYGESDALTLAPGARETLALLFARGATLGLVSSTGCADVLRATNRFSLLKYFSTVICRDIVDNPKPAPDAYLTAANSLGAAPDDCIVIEDSAIGIAAGKAAGMTVVGLSATSIPQDTSGADYQLDTFSQLDALILEKKWIS